MEDPEHRRFDAIRIGHSWMVGCKLYSVHRGYQTVRVESQLRKQELFSYVHGDSILIAAIRTLPEGVAAASISVVLL